MLLWLCGLYISIFLCLVVTIQFRFHSNYLSPSATALSERSTMYTNIFTHKQTELIPPLFCSQLSFPHRQFSISLSNSWASHLGLHNYTTEPHVCSGSWQLAVGIRPLDSSNYLQKLWCLIFIISENADTALTIWEVRGGKRVRESNGIVV